MPNPHFTDAARVAHLSGVITIDSIITSEGKLEEFSRISKGLPYNLNDAALQIMETWRLQTSTKRRTARSHHGHV